MADKELDLVDPDVEIAYKPTIISHEKEFGEGVHAYEIQFNFTVPALRTRKLKIEAVILGVEE